MRIKIRAVFRLYFFKKLIIFSFKLMFYIFLDYLDFNIKNIF